MHHNRLIARVEVKLSEISRRMDAARIFATPSLEMLWPIRIAALILIWSALPAWAQSPPTPAAGSKTKDNLQAISNQMQRLQETAVKNGELLDLNARGKLPKHNILAESARQWAANDRPFLSALLRDGKNDALLKDLGYFAPDAKAYFAEAKALNHEEIFDENGAFLRLLSFEPRWIVSPGAPYSTYVLTDLDYRVIAWRNIAASLQGTTAFLPDGEDHRLDVSWISRRGRSGIQKARFLINRYGIFNYDDPSEDQPHFGEL